MTACVYELNRVADASGCAAALLDAAIILVVSVCAVLVRIIALTA